MMVISCVKLMEMCRLFRTSIRARDAMIVEWIYSRFLHVCIVTRKMQCVEIVLSMMESFCNIIPSKMLHFMQVKKTCPLHDGVDEQGDPMAFSVHDTIIEIL